MPTRTESPSSAVRTVVAGVASMSIEDVVQLARGTARIALPGDVDWLRRVESSWRSLQNRIERGEVVYGVNTGYGDSCGRAVPYELVRELPEHLVRYHGCGLGREFDELTGAAVLAARVASLSRGYSGVRPVLLQRLCDLLNRRVVPVIPEEGSVGASGDLTPLSYVAAVLMGEREVFHRGQRRAAADALGDEHLEVLRLAPKEGLAIMNGTAVMTAIACLAFERAQRLAHLASTITGLAVVALRGNAAHFHPRLFELKPHAGQARSAARIRELQIDRTDVEPSRIQDPYSLRCAPHVIGVLEDSLSWMRGWIETELNSVNDNPLIDGERDLVFHGGHFYGGHIGFAMDALKTAVASVADVLDRQFALLVDERTNRGLPSNLSGAPRERASLNHGFKALQIAVSAWTAEALRMTMPATSFSRSTECHNQDKVSMGTIAARDALRVLELGEQVIVATLLASVQAVHLRDEKRLAVPTRQVLDDVLEWFEPVHADRALDTTLREALARLRARRGIFGEVPSAT